MGMLEDRFFAGSGRTLVLPEHEDAELVLRTLRRGIIKGDYVRRNGEPTKNYFNLDKIY